MMPTLPAPCGTVLRIADGRAMVRLERAAAGACGGCTHGSACGCGIGRLPVARRDLILTVDAPPGLAAGERVAFVVAEEVLPRLALLGYGLPVLFAFLGAALGQGLSGHDGPAALGALCAFALACLAVRLIGERLLRVGGAGVLLPFSSLSRMESDFDE
ncbi:MAG: SoxR reducing system RseC family protein [Azoarcus sp.]|jgi:positive regulator of sigma E activity|nr:SoxR reducing system RseC family protein [Azoarcus sp.]